MNKIFIEFKFEKHLRKILKTSDYFLLKFELISSINVVYAFKSNRKNYEISKKNWNIEKL